MENNQQVLNNWNNLNRYRGILSSRCLKTLCFLKIVTEYGVNLDGIDFSNRKATEEHLEKESNKIKKTNTELSDILKEIVNTGLLSYSDASNTIYYDCLVNLKHEEAVMFFEKFYDFKEYENRQTDKVIIDVIFELVDIKKYNNILDLCSGEGNFLKEVSNKNAAVNISGCEINYFDNLSCKMRMFVAGKKVNLTNCDVLKTKIDDRYDLVFVDYPWSLRTNEDPVANEKDILAYKRNRTKSDWNFIYKAINLTSENGVAIAIAPTGVLYNTPDSLSREEVVKKGLLNTIIRMPAGSYPTTVVSYVIMVFSKGNEKVRLVDAKECLLNSKSANKKIDIEKIKNIINNNDSEYVMFVNNEEIASKKYNLNLDQYFNDVSDIDLINPKPLKEIANVLGGYQYTSRKIEELNPGEGNVSVVKISNIDNGEIDFDGLTSIDVEEDKITKYLLKENDILISTKGTAIKIGLVTNIGDKKLIPYNNLQVIRITSDEVNPIYVCNYLNSETGQQFLKSIQTGSVIININKLDLLNILVPVLDMDTQETIANRYLIIRNNIKELKEKLSILEEKLNSIYDDEVGE
ncbi:MAG: N-6 DNA methylase [Solobacterium sp.]|nr:N-6 DNA methylase [Solobacterium sp.]MDD7775454.1 N-6 DNA methylase [Solobacterium sp.]MDY2953198.1 N-6 DNA methylase [Erysipelotrichaceae bacterium]MDY4791322.1 N-6 DNA methylase [Erysipelotrichaceae bacterium]